MLFPEPFAMMKAHVEITPPSNRPEATTVPEIVIFKDYDLRCSATAIGQGMFAPTLVVSRRTWPSRPRVIAMTGGSFASEAVAIESAHAQGVQWVMDFG